MTSFGAAKNQPTNLPVSKTPAKAAETREPRQELASEVPHMFVHEAPRGTLNVHIMHPDGSHQVHKYAMGDSEGIAAHVHEHYGK